MANMMPAQFVKKWSKIQLKELTAAQSHFNDVCALAAQFVRGRDFGMTLGVDFGVGGDEHQALNSPRIGVKL